MTLNFSQTPQYINQPQNSNFGATNIPVQEPASFSILKGMGLPTNGDEFVKFAPFFGVSVIFSKLVSSFATIASRVNPFRKGNEAITAAESFEKSILGRITRKIDNFLFPILDRNKGTITSAKKTVSKWTPEWLKNLGEKFNRGVAPKNSMALFQYRGATYGASNAFLEVFTKVKPEELAKLGLNAESLRKTATDAMKEGTKKSITEAVENIAGQLKNVKAKDLQKLALATGKNVKLLDELNKARSFIAPTAKTGVSKYLQKGFMYLSEAAGGGVIGGALLGILMNSIFLATTFKRTWEAPWKEKLSTFMEGFFVEFGGIYLTMVLGTRLTYKLLGLKNADKSIKQLDAIKALRQSITSNKDIFKEIEQHLKVIKKEKMTPDIEKAIRDFLMKKIPKEELSGLPKELQQLISQTIDSKTIKNGFFRRLRRLPEQVIPPAPVTKEQAVKLFEQLREAKGIGINKAIDELAKNSKFQAVKKGGFFRNQFNRLLRWSGNVLSVGLETLPTKVGVKGISKSRLFWDKTKYIFKACAGYPLRFILVSMIVTPPLTNFLGKISHTFFGKPTKSIMDEKEGKTETPQASAVQMQQAQQQAGPTMDKMLAYSQLTKQVGELRSAYTKQQQGQLNQPQANISPVATQPNQPFLTQQPKQALPITDKKTVAPTQNTSPATYIPQVTMPKFIDADAAAEVHQKIAKSENIERYAKKELESLHTKNDAYDF